MDTWNFQIELNRPVTDEEIDALYEVGLDDASISSKGALDIDRKAPSFLDALQSAVAQIRKVPGLHAVALLADDAVTLSDAAQRLAGIRTAESLRLYAEGKRGPGGFPAPIAETGKIRVYSWAAICSYLAKLGDPVPQVDPMRALADRALRLRNEVAKAAPDRVEAVGRLFEAA